ncbi:MAG: 4Fe-4S binding protein, partial [Bacteroidales bacterium]
MHRLKIVRVLLGVSTFCLITVYFLDFTGRTPAILHFLPRIQWVPALLSVTPVLSGLFLLSLFFGRLYCSAICPLGIFQDLLIRIFKQIQKPQKVKYHYRKPAGVLRYSILALTLLSFFSGSMGVLILLDPYSNFGRMLSGVFRPVFLLLNNILARIFHAFEWYSIPVYPVEITGLTILSVGSGILILLILVLFTVRHGRMYCNTICPVGTFLGMMAKISLFRLTIDKVECTGCGVCGTVCKGECIDSKHQTIDVSRCVTCFNCLKICRKNAVKYKFVLPSSVKKTSPAYMNESRRKALRFSGVLLGSFVAQRAASAIQTKSADPAASRRVILPPGAVSKDQFNKKCTGCQLCVTKCPSHVLQPATLQYGFGGILQPHLVYR